MRYILTLAAFLLLSASAVSQTDTWYVDPINGDNANGGTSPADAFLSIRAALINVSLESGDEILLAGGIYNDSLGIANGNLDEVFPIELVSGVNLRAGNAFDPPVIDGNSTGGVATVLFAVKNDILTTTYLDGLEMLNCSTAISTDTVGQSPSVNGLVIENCTLSSFATTGIALELISGNSDLAMIRECTITGGVGSDFGIFITTEGTNQILAGGGIEDTVVSGGVQGIFVRAGANGTVGTGFKIIRNTVTGFSAFGIHTAATTFESHFAGAVRGNTITGDGNSGTADVCLVVEASLSVAGFLSLNNGVVAYNDCSLANVNGSCVSTPVNGSGAEVSNSFVGNIFRNASDYGFQFSFTSGTGVGLDPDLGTGVGLAGRNTFNNPNALYEIQMASGMSNSVTMSGNFWPDAGSNAQARIDLNGAPSPTITSILNETLGGVLDVAVIKPDTARSLIISLSTGRFVIQVDESGISDIYATPGSFGQYKLFTLTGASGTVNIQPTDFTGVSLTGDAISFNVPPLEAGNYTLNFTNPGFQTLTPIGLRVTSGGTSGGGSSSSGGVCIVATAAHGDYNAAEVRILRAFRDQYLIPHRSGRALVRGYYKHGEPVAEFIAENEWARKATRAALAPTTAVAYSLLEWNTGQRFLMAVLMLGLFLKVSFGIRKR